MEEIEALPMFLMLLVGLGAGFVQRVSGFGLVMYIPVTLYRGAKGL